MIREARERLGMSQSRVADLVGRAPSTVKAWERGRTQPKDRTVVASLAAVLDLDESELVDSIGLEAAEPKSFQTLEESLSEIAAPDLLPRNHKSRVTPDDPPEPESDTDGPSVETELLMSRRELRAQREGNNEATEGVMDKVSRRLEGVRRIRLRRPGRSKKAVPTRRQQVAVPVTPPPASGPLMVAAPAPSYLEDPQQRLLYRSRSVFLAIGVFVLAIVFVWAAGEMIDSISSSLDAILGNE